MLIAAEQAYDTEVYASYFGAMSTNNLLIFHQGNWEILHDRGFAYEYMFWRTCEEE